MTPSWRKILKTEERIKLATQIAAGLLASGDYTSRNSAQTPHVKHVEYDKDMLDIFASTWMPAVIEDALDVVDKLAAQVLLDAKNDTGKPEETKVAGPLE